MDKGFMVLQKILQAADMRQKVLASNIANADTPGYKAKDIKFGDFFDKELKLLTTSPGHIKNKSNSGVNGRIVAEDSLSWGDGNNVELNVEIGKMTENSLTYNAAIKILNSKIKMYRMAIKGGR